MLYKSCKIVNNPHQHLSTDNNSGTNRPRSNVQAVSQQSIDSRKEKKEGEKQFISIRKMSNSLLTAATHHTAKKSCSVVTKQGKNCAGSSGEYATLHPPSYQSSPRWHIFARDNLAADAVTQLISYLYPPHNKNFHS